MLQFRPCKDDSRGGALIYARSFFAGCAAKSRVKTATSTDAASPIAMMFAAYARDKQSRAGLLFGIEIVGEAPLFFHRLAPRYGCRRKPFAGQLETWQCGSIPSCWSPSWSSPASSARAA